MKKRFLFALPLSVSGTAFAGYEVIPCYDNDPFAFCTVGMPQDGGAPMTQSSAQWAQSQQIVQPPISPSLGH